MNYKHDASYARGMCTKKIRHDIILCLQILSLLLFLHVFFCLAFFFLDFVSYITPMTIASTLSPIITRYFLPS